MRSEEPKEKEKVLLDEGSVGAISNDKEGRSSVQTTNDKLFSWYVKHGRHELPWRKTKDPYKIYLSEIMLQQTRVATVLERFYFPFLERFPTLKSVTEASQEEVLKAWEGLGYYSRARNLHKTAKLCGGVLPRSSEELLRLPGIGKSTARAIACFAFGEAKPILDANVKRILYRYYRRRKATEKELWKMAERLFDPERPYEWNQGMMDLGATLCLPVAPRCRECPLAAGCRGKETPLRYPASRERRTRPVRKESILVLESGGRLALQRSRKRFHGGLWHFPRCEEEWPGEELGVIRQVYSHFTLEGRVLKVDSLPEGFTGVLRFFGPKEIEKLPMGGADRKALELAAGSGGFKNWERVIRN